MGFGGCRARGRLEQHQYKPAFVPAAPDAHLCGSSRHLEPKSSTLYLSFRDRRISSDFVFLHSPPPRHLRLAWPAAEPFYSALHPAEITLGKSADMGTVARYSTRAPPSEESMVAICTMFKNEAPNLEEWLQYHRMLGVFKVGAQASTD